MGKKALWIPLLLLALSVGSRLPFQSRTLYDFDSIAYASGVESFDVSKFCPHPPGYPLYVLCGKILNAVLRDPNRSLVWLSIGANSACVIVVFWLGTRIFSRRTGVVSALLLAFSPLFWLFGEVALPYTFGCLFSAGIALASWEGRRGGRWGLFLASLLLGAGCGFRPDVLLGLGPLWLYSMRGLRPGDILLCFLLCAGVMVAWFVPVIHYAGGWNAYWDVVEIQKLGIQRTGALVNIAKICAYSGWGLGFLLLLLPLGLFRSSWGTLAGAGRPAFFAVWMAPYVLGATFFAFGQPGMLLLIFPPIVLLLSHFLLVFGGRFASGLKGREIRDQVVVVAAVGILLAGNAFLFVRAPFLGPAGFVQEESSFLEKVNTEFFLLSARGIRFLDRFYTSSFSYIQRHFDPSETVVLTNFAGWVHASYYLKGFKVLNYFLLRGVEKNTAGYVPEGTFEIPEKVDRIVLFNGNRHSIALHDSLEPYNLSADQTRQVRTPEGFSLAYLIVEDHRVLGLTKEGFRLQE